MSDEELRQMILLNEIRKNRHSFWLDLLANISGNGIWDGLIYIGTRILKKL